MMRRVDREHKGVAPVFVTSLRVPSCPLWFCALARKRRWTGSMRIRNNLGERGLCLNRDGMRDGDFSSRLVIHFRASVFRQEVRDVLDERTLAENVQTLQAVTDAEHGLAVSVRKFEEKIVYFFPPHIRRCRVWGFLLPESCRIDIRIAAGQQHTIAAIS